MRVSALLAFVLALVGCDLTEASLEDRVVGTWEASLYSAETVVTSTIDQRVILPSLGSVEVSGARAGSMTQFEGGVSFLNLIGCEPERQLSLRGICTRASMVPGQVGLSQDSLGNQFFFVDHVSPDVTFSFADSTLRVPTFEIPTAEGVVRVGGSIRRRQQQLRAGVPARLRTFDVEPEGLAPLYPTQRLSLSADGRGVSGAGEGAQAFTWQIADDTLTMI